MPDTDRPPPNKAEVSREVAAMVDASQKKLMAEMRRRTTLDDEQIVKLLEPFSETAFGAGYKVGWNDAEWHARALLARAGLYRVAMLVASAALVSWWIVSR